MPQYKNSQRDADMLGKLAGAFIGEKIAGRNSGAKGALVGAGVAALAKRGLPTLLGAAAVGYGLKKLWDRRSKSPSYPSDATPSSSSD
jgi:hypothetical protein